MTFSLPNSHNIHRVQLPNGITVLAYANPHVRSVNLSGTLKAGSLYETNDKIGVASLTASALMHGTHHRDFDTIHSTLEDIGADLGMGAGIHTLNFNGKALAEDLPVLLDLLADTLRYPSFPEDHLGLVRNQRLTELKYAQQDTRYRAGRAFRERLYPATHPYHYSNYGTLESIPSITTDDLHQFHRHAFGARGMILAVVGAIDPQQVMDVVHAKLGDWVNDQQVAEAQIAPINPPTEAYEVFTPIEGKTQSDIVLGTLAPSRYASDYMAASLGNSILGEFGMMGRIGGVIREDLGLAYYASSALEGSESQGVWTISACVAPQNVRLAIEKATDELRRMTEELVSDDDLSDNQSYYTGRLPLRLESNGGIASTLEGMERFGLGLDYLANYREMIYSITKEDVLQVCRKYFNVDALVVSIAGVNGA